MHSLKRNCLALLCAVALALGLTPAASALTGDAGRAADILHTMGLVQGSGSGYDENRPATRAEAAVLLVRLAGLEKEAGAYAYEGAFTDLPAWASGAIRLAAANGWVSGVSETSFAPDRAVSADDWCTMLLRLLGYDDRNGDFTHSGAALFAQHVGLTSDTYTAFARGDLFETALAALTFPKKDGGGTLAENLVQKSVVSQAVLNAVGLGSRELTARQVADRYTAAVFRLDAYATQSEADKQTPSGNASGFFISADGLAVTNYHSIDGCVQAVATLSTGEQYKVERVLYYDAGIDVAVVRVSTVSLKNEKTSGFAHLEMASRDTVRNGDTVYTLGNPLGLGLAISSGIVSSRMKDVESYALPMIQNTADISMGSSGGALLNAYGQVVGITSGAYVYGNNLYLAVPIDPVLDADLTGEGWTLREVKDLEAKRAGETKDA